MSPDLLTGPVAGGDGGAGAPGHFGGGGGGAGGYGVVVTGSDLSGIIDDGVTGGGDGGDSDATGGGAGSGGIGLLFYGGTGIAVTVGNSGVISGGGDGNGGNGNFINIRPASCGRPMLISDALISRGEPCFGELASNSSLSSLSVPK